MLQAKVGKQCVSCMIDSGASVSVLSHSIFSLLNSKSYTVVPRTVTAVCGVNNQKQPILAQINTTVNIGPLKLKQTFVVIDMHVPVLLGLDFLTTNKAKLNFQNSSLQIGSHKFKLSSPPTRATRAHTIRSEIIPANASQLLKVRLERPPVTGVMLLTPFSRFRRKCPGADMMPSLVDKQDTFCRIVNDSDSPICIRKGVSIAIARTEPLPNICSLPDFCNKKNSKLQSEFHDV